MVVGNGFDDHVTNLVTVLVRLRTYNLKLKTKKCHPFQTEVLFLGKLVGREGVSVNPGSIQVVTKWAIPTTATSLFGAAKLSRRTHPLVLRDSLLPFSTSEA